MIKKKLNPIIELSWAKNQERMPFAWFHFIGKTGEVYKRSWILTLITSMPCRAQQTMKEQVNISFFHIKLIVLF